jgi:hypothetical protein
VVFGDNEGEPSCAEFFAGCSTARRPEHPMILPHSDIERALVDHGVTALQPDSIVMAAATLIAKNRAFIGAPWNAVARHTPAMNAA